MESVMSEQAHATDTLLEKEEQEDKKVHSIGQKNNIKAFMLTAEELLKLKNIKLREEIVEKDRYILQLEELLLAKAIGSRVNVNLDDYQVDTTNGRCELREPIPNENLNDLHRVPKQK
jgi:hypothetical protein